MQIQRYLAAIGLATLLAWPAVAQTTAPTTATGKPPAGQVTPPASTGKSPAAAATPAPASPAPTQKQELIDINSASSAELDKLPGIGTARAQAIIANRPYRGKDDLLQRKLIPANVYEQIKDKIIARQSPPAGAGTAPANPSKPSR